MRISWKLGRIAGIDLFLHPTFLLILLPGMTGGLSAFFIVALFGCVVLHELGHALMARRFGIETLDITLYPIGGVARLQRMPRAPGAELLIALAGPAVNFAIVAGLLGLELLGIGGMESDSSLGAFLAGLMLVNLVLGLFNLIPAFPMDGGRVLRALLTGWLGRARATSIAATIGRALAVAFGVYSLLIVFPPNVGRFHLFRGRRRGVQRDGRGAKTCLLYSARPGDLDCAARLSLGATGQWCLATGPDCRDKRRLETELLIMGRLTPIVELGVAEAFAILTEQLGVSREGLPPLDAIENEDWGRDLLLSKLQEIDARTLAAIGLSRQDAE